MQEVILFRVMSGPTDLISSTSLQGSDEIGGGRGLTSSGLL